MDRLLDIRLQERLSRQYPNLTMNEIQRILRIEPNNQQRHNRLLDSNNLAKESRLHGQDWDQYLRRGGRFVAVPRDQRPLVVLPPLPQHIPPRRQLRRVPRHLRPIVLIEHKGPKQKGGKKRKRRTKRKRKSRKKKTRRRNTRKTRRRRHR